MTVCKLFIFIVRVRLDDSSSFEEKRCGGGRRRGREEGRGRGGDAAIPPASRPA
jgi:hypothetical protein